MKLAFTSRARGGKTTLAQLMANKYGGHVLSFATPLKDLAQRILQRPLDKAKDRPFLVELGAIGRGEFTTEQQIDWLKQRILPLFYSDGTLYPGEGIFWLLRNANKFGENYWAQQPVNVVTENEDGYWSLDDLTTENEAALLRQAGFKVIKLIIPEDVCEQRILDLDGPQDETMENDPKNDWLKIEADLTIPYINISTGVPFSVDEAIELIENNFLENV